MDNTNIYNIIANEPPSEYDEFDEPASIKKTAPEEEDFNIDVSDVKDVIMKDAKPILGKIIKAGITTVSGILVPAGGISGLVMFIPVAGPIIAAIILIAAIVIILIIMGVWVLGGIIAVFIVFNRFNSSLLTDGLGKFLLKLLIGFMLSWTYIFSSNKTSGK